MPATPEIKSVKRLARPETVFALARVPGTSRLVFGGSDARVYDVDMAAEKPEPRALGGGGHESYVTGVAVAGRWAVSGSYDGRLCWWDLDRGECVRTVHAHAKWVRGVAASPDGATVASVADDMVCRLWDVATGEKRAELRGHPETTPHHFPSMLFACTFSPDGAHLSTADKVGHVVIWEVSTGRQASALEAPGLYTWDPVQRRHSIGGVRALAFSPDGARLAVGGIGKIHNVDHLDGPARVEVFDWKSGTRTHELASDATKGLVERLVFLPGTDRLLAVGGAHDGFLLLIDPGAGSVEARVKAPAHLHAAAPGDTPGTVFTAGHRSLDVYEVKGLPG